MKLFPVGLFDRLANQLALLSYLPEPVLKGGGPLLAKLHILPDDMQNTLASVFAPQNKDGAMAFLKMITRWILDARSAADNGKKVILVPFNFPPEIIHAFEKAVPLTSEVMSTLGVLGLNGQGERYWDMAMGLGLPDHMCSANTIELGSMLGSEDFRPQALISSGPGGCDVNSKIHELVSHHLGIPQFFLQKPPEDSGRGFNYYTIYMRALIKQLEEFLGEKMTEQKLRKVIEKANRCAELYLEMWDLHKAVPCPVPNLFSLFLYGTRFTMWGTDEAIANLETLVSITKKRLAEKAYPAEKEVARCLWCYVSYYFDFSHFFNWMEEQGYTHLGDGLNLCFPQIIDTSTMDSMLKGLTLAAWNMPMTRQVGAESMSRSWSEDCIYAVKELNADCVIFPGHHSCKQTWSVASILRNEVTKRTGVPVLFLQGDAWIKKMTPMSVIQQEIDEFIKNVVLRKSSGKRKIRRKGEQISEPGSQG